MHGQLFGRLLGQLGIGQLVARVNSGLGTICHGIDRDGQVGIGLNTRSYSLYRTTVSCARGTSREQRCATKVTDAGDVFCTSGFRVAAMDLPDIRRILAVNITV